MTGLRQLSSKLAVVHEAGDPDFGLILLHWCPACDCAHVFNVEKPLPNGAVWSWDSNLKAPSFHPSMHIVGLCHYWLRNGVLEFCPDSQHALAGQTVPLPDIPPSTWGDDS